MHPVSLFVVVVCVVAQVHGGTQVKNSLTTSKVDTNTANDDSLDDRFNLNVNYAHAHGVGQYGGVSQSDSLSYGVNAGIRGPGGHYQSLLSDSGSRGNSFSTGPGAPLTYANTGSGYGGGYGNAGLYGGQGSAFAGSQSQNIEIPLDPYGTVLLSNLEERPVKAKPATATTPAKPASKKQTDSLVLA